MYAKRPKTAPRPRTGDEGVALITALGMLLLFSLLGTAYLSFMTLERDEGLYDTRIVRARHLAEGGITAAVGEIRKAIAEGETPKGQYTFQIPVYVLRGGELEPFDQEVTVEVQDESRLINVNHAPREVLEAIGIDRATFRELRSSLPQTPAELSPETRWLSSVSELESRGFLTSRELHELNRSILTVYTALDPYEPARYININSAPPAVLAAIFNINSEEAAALAEKRPFTTWEDAVTKSGREPTTFNIRPSLKEPFSMPTELALSSRCFRLNSRALLRIQSDPDQRVRGVRRETEAVVLIHDDGSYEIRFWSETPTEFLEDVPEEQAGEEDPESQAPLEPAADDAAAPEGGDGEEAASEPAPNQPEQTQTPQ